MLDGIEESLRHEDPQFTGGFDAVSPRLRQPRIEARVCTLVLVGALLLCAGVGVGVVYFNAAIGAPLAALGCVLLGLAVQTARLLPDNPTSAWS